MPFRRVRTTVEPTRKSRPFWSILGDCGVPAAVLRVPITFPPEKFRGLLLSAMCVPDLRGTQGTYTLYDSRPLPEDELTEGVRIQVEQDGDTIQTHLPGPPLDDDGSMDLPMRIRVDREAGTADLHLDGSKVRLTKGDYSDWTAVTWRAGLRKAGGLCRFLLISVEPHFRLYVTPINIDPARPAMPISHPRYYSAYLAKLIGPYATLGLAEDTWALTHGIISDGEFLQQVWDIHSEREQMLMESLDRMRSGLCCCVFDAADRAQHMFWRHTEAPASGDAPDATIDEVYRRLDTTVGRVMEKLDADTPLFVISDHGFSSFTRGVNLNAWLKQEGLLVAGTAEAPHPDLSHVDWEKTKAYTFGLSGVYINLRGREDRGIVTEEESKSLKAELAAKLLEVTDPRDGRRPVRAVYDAAKTYVGPYSAAGPDLVVGFDAGYRASWEAALGRIDGDIFSDNERPWSGDHCVDHSLVPGVLFCNRALELPETGPHITDLAPTVLDLFGISAPDYMDGKALAVKNAAGNAGASDEV